jgi:hypothetical protein
MRNHYRPQIQNGPVAKRARRSLAPPAAAVPKVAAEQPPLRRQCRPASAAAVREMRPPRVLVALTLCGALIAAGFILGLHEHFVAYALGREEVRIQSQIELATSEARALDSERRQAGSPQSLAQAVGQRGRVQPLKLDAARPQAKAAPSAKATPSPRPRARLNR